MRAVRASVGALQSQFQYLGSERYVPSFVTFVLWIPVGLREIFVLECLCDTNKSQSVDICVTEGYDCVSISEMRQGLSYLVRKYPEKSLREPWG